MPTKTEELTATEAAFKRLIDIVRPLDDAHGTWKEAHGTWSVVNLLQHMDGWLREMTPALQRLARGERPTPEGVDYSDIDAWNAEFVEVRGEQTVAAAITAIEEGYTAFRASAESVDADRFGDNKTANRLVNASGAHHFDEHADDIKKYLTGTH